MAEKNDTILHLYVTVDAEWTESKILSLQVGIFCLKFLPPWAELTP